MKIVKLNDIKTEYQNWLQSKFGDKAFTTDEILDISLELFDTLKIEEIYRKLDDDYDILLFEYGIYGISSDEFIFSIIRHISLLVIEGYGATYQLSVSLYFENVDCEDFDCWSYDFENLTEFAEHIRQSKGYNIAKNLKYKKYELYFEECG